MVDERETFPADRGDFPDRLQRLRAAYAPEAIALTLVSEKRSIKKSPEYANSFFALSHQALGEERDDHTEAQVGRKTRPIPRMLTYERYLHLLRD
jgi:hypothetical protein